MAATLPVAVTGTPPQAGEFLVTTNIDYILTSNGYSKPASQVAPDSDDSDSESEYLTKSEIISYSSYMSSKATWADDVSDSEYPSMEDITMIAASTGGSTTLYYPVTINWNGNYVTSDSLGYSIYALSGMSCYASSTCTGTAVSISAETNSQTGISKYVNIGSPDASLYIVNRTYQITGASSTSTYIDYIKYHSTLSAGYYVYEIKFKEVPSSTITTYAVSLTITVSASV